MAITFTEAREVPSGLSGYNGMGSSYDGVPRRMKDPLFWLELGLFTFIVGSKQLPPVARGIGAAGIGYLAFKTYQES